MHGPRKSTKLKPHPLIGTSIIIIKLQLQNIDVYTAIFPSDHVRVLA